MFEKPLGLRENPFLAGHHPRYLFPSREHQEALAHLRYGIQNREPFVLITGEVGTGKTTAVYDALAEWGSRAVVALITNSALTRTELLEEICTRFGVTMTSPMSKPQALVELQKQLCAVRERGELAILLVDEAQNLDRDLLEEIRLLSNLEVSGEYLLQIFLVGQPELEAKLAQKELRQLRQRIGIHYRILPLSATESARYIHHRVAVAGGNAEELFPADTCVELFRITHGIPREINIVAGQSLLNAFVEDSRSVTIAHVRAVEREIEFQSVLMHQADTLKETEEPAAGTTRKKKSARPVPPAPTAPSAAILPIAPTHAPTKVKPSRKEPAPPVEYVAHAEMTESEMDVEVSESAFGEALPDADDALVDEFPVRDEPHTADDDIEERSTPGTGRRETELTLPSWIDEIVTHRQTMEGRIPASTPSTSRAAPAAPLAPPANVWEPAAGSAPPTPAPPSGAMVAAPPPERIAPSHPEPLPLFDRPAGSVDPLPARLRSKVNENEEPGSVRRSSIAWPIASIVIAAIAITVLLLVRLGPWAHRRGVAAPVGAPASAGSPDTNLNSMNSFPPLGGTAGPRGAAHSRTVRFGGEPLSDTSRNQITLPVSATGESATSVPTEPSPGAPADGATPDPSSTQTTSGGATGDPAGPGALPASIGPPSFGITVGTYLNEGRANAERARLVEITKLTARVIAVDEDTVPMFRVVVGSFGDRTSAEQAAGDLVQRGLVTEARVVTVAQAAPKQP